MPVARRRRDEQEVVEMALSSKDMERLSVIRGAMEEIANRPDLKEAAKQRGLRALKKAEARVLSQMERSGTARSESQNLRGL